MINPFLLAFEISFHFIVTSFFPRMPVSATGPTDGSTEKHYEIAKVLNSQECYLPLLFYKYQ